MQRTLEHDECLERIWHLRERGIGPSVASAAADGVREQCLRELEAGAMLAIAPGGGVTFTPEGRSRPAG